MHHQSEDQALCGCVRVYVVCARACGVLWCGFGVRCALVSIVQYRGVLVYQRELSVTLVQLVTINVLELFP